MDHQLGGINLIRWQGRRNRKVKAGVTLWTVCRLACALVGGAMLAVQALSGQPWSAPLAVIPVSLLLLAAASQIVAAARAAATWFVG